MNSPQPDPHQPVPALALAAVAVLSAAMLAFELTLTRLFALAQFYHFAFMAISLALLGSGAAGSLLSVWPRLAGRPGRWAAGFALAALSSYAVLNWIPFDSYAIAWDRRQVIYLLLTFGSAAVPFLFGGVVIGGLLAAHTGRAHRIYAANLVGSAAGCVAVLPVLAGSGGEGALLASAAAGLVSAALFTLAPGQRTTSAQRVAGVSTAAAACAALIALILLRPGWFVVRLSPYKGLIQAMLAPGAQHTVSAWGAAARIDVVESDAIHIMPGLSQNALIAWPPRQAGLTIDGDNLMPITALAPDDELALQLAANMPSAVLWALRPGSRTLLIVEPGGGWDVLMALASSPAPQATAVTVAERDRLITHVLQNEYSAFSRGLYSDPRVTVVAEPGRTFVRRTDAHYDVILLSLSDSFHPVTSGAFTLAEDYRYTVEALQDHLVRLKPGGILVITRWLQMPPTESVRVLAALEAALAGLGINHPADHIAAFRSMRTMTFAVSLSPLTLEDSTAVRRFAGERGYDIVWLPDVSPDEVNRHNRLPEPVYYTAFSSLLANPDEFIRTYPYDVRPPTDDRPFFFHYFRWQQTPEIVAGLGHTWQPFGGSGYLVLVALLGLVCVLAVVLIIGPQLLVSRMTDRRSLPPPRIRWRVLLYFGMLGLGFLFIELPLAQRFILFIGQPVTALAVVLFAILVFSGVGSLTAPRWHLPVALAALIAVALLTPVALRGLFQAALGWPLVLRVALTVVALAPLGVLMGIPFARGLVIMEATAPGLTAWAWAINGSLSVVSAVLAVMLALSLGFTAVLGAGAAAYGVALVAILPFAGRRPGSSPPGEGSTRRAPRG